MVGSVGGVASCGTVVAREKGGFVLIEAGAVRIETSPTKAFRAVPVASEGGERFVET